MRINWCISLIIFGEIVQTLEEVQEHIIFFQGGPIDHGTHVQGQVSQSILEIEYNAVCTAGMALANFRMLVHDFLNKGPDIFQEESLLMIFENKSPVCMAYNGKDTKHTRHISRRIDVVRNDEKCKIDKIDWCEGSLQLIDIATKNVGENNLTPIIKYIMVRLYN